MTAVRLSRRALLSGTCSALLLAPMAQSAGLAALYDDTIWDALVRAIAGPVELSPPLSVALTRDFGAKFGLPSQRDMVNHFGRNGIVTVLDTQADPIESQVQWIASYLFTGSADPSDDDALMMNYPYALGWKSLRFAKAPGLCSGPEFGYWLQPWEVV
jgi:hypothetical protein